MASDWGNMAISITIMLFCINAVVFAGYSAAGMSFDNLNIFTFLGVTGIGYAEEMGVDADNPEYIEISGMGADSVKAEGTDSGSEDRAFIEKATESFNHPVSLLDKLTFMHIYILDDLLDLPVEILFIAIVPLTLLQILGYLFLTSSFISRVLGLIR